MSLSVNSVQAISGAAFSTFSVLHLATHFSAIISQKAHKKVYTTSRAFYQNKVIEIGLGIAVIVHGGTAIYKYYKNYQRRRKLKNNNNANNSSSRSTDYLSARQLNKYFGIMLLFMTPLHFFGARLEPLKLIGAEAASKLDGSQIYSLLQSSMWKVGKIFFSILYPIGFYHTIYGLNICYQRFFKTKPLINPNSKVLSYGVIVAGSVIIQLALRGYRGERYEVNISDEQRDLFKPVIDHIEHEMGGN